MKLAYGYGEITVLTNFDIPVHDNQMKDTDENLEEITAELSIVTISDDKKKRRNKYGS